MVSILVWLGWEVLGWLLVGAVSLLVYSLLGIELIFDWIWIKMEWEYGVLGGVEMSIESLSFFVAAQYAAKKKICWSFLLRSMTLNWRGVV